MSGVPLFIGIGNDGVNVMKLTGLLISAGLILMVSSVSAANDYKTVKFGEAEVAYNFSPPEEGVATLTVTALVYETNDSLRGVKNSDQRRLSKLGQLIYQCKLLQYKPTKSDSELNLKDPVLVSKNYSLFSGVDLELASHEGVGIQVEAIQVTDDESLFTSTLGNPNNHKVVHDYLGRNASINLRQISLHVLNESDILQTAESVDINIRFPVFQLESPAHQWRYSFNMIDFKQAIKYTDEQCTPDRLMRLVNAGK